ncbi:MAG: uroporphyrinogen decarboxylase [Oscillospiraceae bacterium]|nr:uroporphyrinogen decarboxylase [Oscillospiraceae bacterium]
MLTAKQNMQETIRGGNPDRFVNQYEALRLLFHPYLLFSSPLQAKGDPDVINGWGVTNSFPANVPGAFPVHTPEKIVVKDIQNWRDYVKSPPLKFTDEQWGVAKAMYDEIDGTQAYKGAFVAPGLFEQTHHLCEISNALEYYLTDPDEMKDLLKYLTDWELELAEGICKHLKPDAMFHHDDWGSEKSTFMSPNMFADYFVEPYKQIYGYYHDHGVELVIHHADSWAETLVPYMIEMGIDIWQGCMESNDIEGLIKKYGGQISFMGGIDNKSVDFTGWTQEDCRRVARNTCDKYGNKYFIPCITQGGPGSLYDGTYTALTEEIDNYNMEKFGIKKEEIERLPIQIMF